uniref:Uncharacterized protein n=1 Tax=Zea mays TaxID=4577 RepID=C0PLT4_MAIZE|nr:unknown [Zea mays]
MKRRNGEKMIHDHNGKLPSDALPRSKGRSIDGREAIETSIAIMDAYMRGNEIRVTPSPWKKTCYRKQGSSLQSNQPGYSPTHVLSQLPSSLQIQEIHALFTALGRLRRRFFRL